MNSKNFKIIILIVDFIAISLFAIMMIKWFNNRNNNVSTENTNDTNVANFKLFSFYMPDDVKYSTLDYDTFTFTTDDYKANILIFLVEDDNDLEKYIGDYGEYLKSHGVDVTDVNTTLIGDTTVYYYNKTDEQNSVLCYFKLFLPFLCEVELYNTDNTFDIANLEPVLDILLDTDYNQESDLIFSYYTAYEMFHMFDIKAE